MVNFCEHRIVTFSLKFVFRGHCIILKSYNQWGGRFSVGDEGGGSFVSKWWELPVGEHRIGWEGFKKNNGNRGNPGT